MLGRCPWGVDTVCPSVGQVSCETVSREWGRKWGLRNGVAKWSHKDEYKMELQR